MFAPLVGKKQDVHKKYMENNVGGCLFPLVPFSGWAQVARGWHWNTGLCSGRWPTLACMCKKKLLINQPPPFPLGQQDPGFIYFRPNRAAGSQASTQKAQIAPGGRCQKASHAASAASTVLVFVFLGAVVHVHE